MRTGATATGGSNEATSTGVFVTGIAVSVGVTRVVRVDVTEPRRFVVVSRLPWRRSDGSEGSFVAGVGGAVADAVVAYRAAGATGGSTRDDR